MCHTRSSPPVIIDASTTASTAPAWPAAVRAPTGSDHAHTGYSAPATAPTR